MSIFIKIKTALNLGAVNLLRVLTYRLGIKFGINPFKRLTAIIVNGDFFTAIPASSIATLPVNHSWNNQHCYFGWFVKQTDNVPNWQQNCFTGKLIAGDKPWWLIPDFSADVGDIKTVWEASRFDWVISFMQQACNSDAESIGKCNSWLQDWLNHNPPYLGANWKCGQEVSIRLMHLALAALIGRQVKSTSICLQQLVAAHLVRVTPTLRYAIAQDNNHGTSEAAALFIGGSWLALFGHPEARDWAKQGRKWLENRARRLIESDGSFSQYSVTYHRVMLDTYSMVEVWRQSLDLPPFSSVLYTKLSAATSWLYQMPGIAHGDIANVGANDGARLFPLVQCDYRDCRPTVQLAARLFLNQRAFAQNGIWDLPLKWLRLEPAKIPMPDPQSIQLDKGGYAVLRNDTAVALMRYPRFKFRPSQADALHIDFWLDGENILRDGGSYSYNAEPELVNYFSGTTSHNTVQFDDRDQMPKLSRFLFGEWLKTNYLQPICISETEVSFAAGYTDYKDATHQRDISLSASTLTVQDRISGFKQQAVIRWRLSPGVWQLEGNTLKHEKMSLVLSSDCQFELHLSEGQESKYYLKTSVIPVLELRTKQQGTFTTELFFK